MENSNDPIGSGIRPSPSGIAVPQPTVPHNAPSTTDFITNKLRQSGKLLTVCPVLCIIVQRALINIRYLIVRESSWQKSEQQMLDQ
jgi:hypothetical protein